MGNKIIVDSVNVSKCSSLQKNKNCYYKKYKILSEIIKDIKDLIKNEHCANLENCDFCANVGDCLNKKILEKINQL